MTTSRQIPIVCPGHTRPLAELQFCRINDEDGDTEKKESRTILVSACHDKNPMLRDGHTGDWIGTFSGHKGAVWSCRLDPRAYLAATASGDFSARVWDAITGKPLFGLPHKHIVKTLDFSNDSKFLATGGHEGILRVYALDQCDVGDEDCHPVLQMHQREDMKVTISKCLWYDDKTVLAGCSDGVVRFWDVSACTRGNVIEGGKGIIEGRLLGSITVDDKSELRDMELSKIVDDNKSPILTVAAGSKVYFYDLSSHNETSILSDSKSLLKSHSMPMHFRDEGGASLHPSGTKFIAGGSDLWVRVFDFETGKQLECHKGHHGPIRCLRFAPDGLTFGTGSEDGTIRLWKTE